MRNTATISRRFRLLSGVDFVTLANALVLLLGSLCSQQSRANESNPQQQILLLLNSEQIQQAFQLASDSIVQWEGDPEFDFALALAAKAAGKLQQAVFAFERVLNRQPSSFHARYSLAVTYFELHQWQAAKEQFDLLQQSKVQHPYQSRIVSYLKAIEQTLSRQSSHWQNWLQVGAGIDSNANNGVDDEFINIPWLGDIRLFEQSREIESAFSDVQAQLLYAQPISQQRAWYAGINVQSAQYVKSLAWDRTYLSAVTGYRDRWQHIDLDFSAFYRPLRLDGDAYLTYAGMLVNASYPLSTSEHIGASVSFAVESYQQANSRDKEQYIAAFWYGKKVRKSTHKLVLRLGQENAREPGNSHLDRNLWGASYQVGVQLDHKTNFSGKLDYLDGYHGNDEPLFQAKRKTALLRVEAQMDYQFLPNWLATLTVSHMSHNSNLALYDYQRTKALASVRYSF